MAKQHHSFVSLAPPPNIGSLASPLMDTSSIAAITKINFLASSTITRSMACATNLIQPIRPSTKPETITLQSFYNSFPRSPLPSSRNNTLFLTRCSTKPGIDSNNATNRNSAIELGSSSAAQPVATPAPNQALTSTGSRGLVFDLGSKSSWDGAEIGSPVVKRYIGDNEERWYMWYHGRSGHNVCDAIGLAVSSNGIHWARGEDTIRSCADAGMVMDCRKNWWAFDTEGMRPSEMVIMSSPMYSAVYWLYYTGVTSEEIDTGIGKVHKSLPGLACSQDGRHWARIEGDHHSGALLDVGSRNEWDSLFIAAAHVVVHGSDDLRMYYHSFDAAKGHYAIGVARSRDGIRWVKLGKILGGGTPGSFDELGVKNACVVRKNKEGKYLMAYEGVDADGKTSIGLAESSDGLRDWKRLQQEPVLESSDESGWDCQGVGSPSLVQMDGNAEDWRLYYVGVGQEGKTGIGMAKSQGDGTLTFTRWEGVQL